FSFLLYRSSEPGGNLAMDGCGWMHTVPGCISVAESKIMRGNKGWIVFADQKRIKNPVVSWRGHDRAPFLEHVHMRDLRIWIALSLHSNHCGELPIEILDQAAPRIQLWNGIASYVNRCLGQIKHVWDDNCAVPAIVQFLDSALQIVDRVFDCFGGGIT